MTETRTILGDIYDALREQNLDQLASYLPNDFCHTINFPPEIHPVGGIRRGKPATLARLGQIFSEFECVQLDTSGLMVDAHRAVAEVTTHCQHRGTGVSLQTVKANFWTIESGWPVRLNEYYDIGDIQVFISAVSARVSA